MSGVMLYFGMSMKRVCAEKFLIVSEVALLGGALFIAPFLWPAFLFLLLGYIPTKAAKS